MNIPSSPPKPNWEWVFHNLPKQRTFFFVSWGRWWKGVYFNSKLGTLRLFLWDWDWSKKSRWSYIGK